MVSLCVPTLNQYALLDGLIDSALKSTVKPDHIYIFDNGLKLKEEYPDLVNRVDAIIQPPYQVALAAAWNFFLHNIPGDKIIANDDLLFHENTIEKLIEARNTNPREIFFCSGGIGALNAFSLFFVDDRFVHVVEFDENFYPAYYEDNDAARQLTLAGFQLVHADCTADHLGSATLRAYTPEQMDRHHLQFRRNSDYYSLKWGGMPHAEAYTIPFDGRDAQQIVAALEEFYK